MRQIKQRSEKQMKEYQEQFHFRKNSEGLQTLLTQARFTLLGMTILLTSMLVCNAECFIAL